MDTATRLNQSRQYQPCVLLLPSVGSIMLALIAALIFLTPLLIAAVVPKTQGLRLPKILEQARSQLIFESQNGQRLHRMWRLTILAWLAKILAMAILLATLSGIAVTDVVSIILAQSSRQFCQSTDLLGRVAMRQEGSLAQRLLVYLRYSRLR